MSTAIKNMLVGVFILGAITLFVCTILFLKPTVGDGKQILKVRFSSINNLGVGTRVLFAGKPIGEVVAMKEIQDAREQPTDELGRVYFYELILHIDSKVRVFNTDEISIQTSGLLGEKSIGITPKAPPKGVTPALIVQPIYADSVDPFQNALLDFADLSAQMEETFRRAGEWLKEHGEILGKTVANTSATLETINEAVMTYNQSGLTKDVSLAVQGVNTALDQLQAKETFQHIGEVAKQVASVSDAINQGKGTLGRLIVDQDLYLQANAVMTKANSLMNDLNHYGILFHLNKEWQRTRLKRVSALNALQTPEAFRSYFQQEVDDINTSMSRISMLIDRAENNAKKTEIFHSNQFKNDFFHLLQRVDELSDNLRLYNQQLLDAEGN